MTLTEVLSSEHRVIEQVIAALDAAARRIETGEAVRPGFFMDAAGFIAEFADGYHHGKEERVLFEAMAQRGVPTETGPIAVMLYEHDEGRRLTAGLRDAAARLAAGETGAAYVVADYASAYGDVLAQHIFKEDNILFPLANRVIAPHEWAALAQEAESAEDEPSRNRTKAWYVALAKALCDEMDVDPTAAPRRAVDLPCHAR
jgi:hemerythrin-like domain-containing protein